MSDFAFPPLKLLVAGTLVIGLTMTGFLLLADAWDLPMWKAIILYVAGLTASFRLGRVVTSHLVRKDARPTD